MLDNSFKEQLASCFPLELFSSDKDTLAEYGRDWTRFHTASASLVFFPRHTQDVSTFLKLCSQSNVRVVPSGGRTGLAGGAVAASGEVVLSLKRLNKICEIDLISATVRVGAGAITQTVLEKCASCDLNWPIDLAAKGSSTIGGNIATNAGGLRVIRYGHTRSWVQSLKWC